MRKCLVHDFLRGIKSVNDMQIKVMVKRQKVKITRDVIFEMLQLLSRGFDIEWLGPLQ